MPSRYSNSRPSPAAILTESFRIVHNRSELTLMARVGSLGSAMTNGEGLTRREVMKSGALFALAASLPKSAARASPGATPVAADLHWLGGTFGSRYYVGVRFEY